jgi:hypothetical protein
MAEADHAGFLGGLFDCAEDGAGAGQHRGSGGREFDAAAAAFEQCCAEFVFELADLLAAGV